MVIALAVQSKDIYPLNLHLTELVTERSLEHREGYCYYSYKYIKYILQKKLYTVYFINIT